MVDLKHLRKSMQPESFRGQVRVLVVALLIVGVGYLLLSLLRWLIAKLSIM